MFCWDVQIHFPNSAKVLPLFIYNWFFFNIISEVSEELYIDLRHVYYVIWQSLLRRDFIFLMFISEDVMQLVTSSTSICASRYSPCLHMKIAQHIIFYLRP